MKKLLLLIVLAASFGSFSCQEDNEPASSERLTIEEMSSMPGYIWVKDRMATYQPDSVTIEKLRSLPKDGYKVYAFVAGDCDCGSNRKYFSELAKVISLIDLPDTSAEYYAMPNKRSKHPYTSILNISSLPAFYVVKNGTPVYSVMDTINLVLDKKLSYPSKIEECLYEAMK